MIGNDLGGETASVDETTGKLCKTCSGKANKNEENKINVFQSGRLRRIFKMNKTQNISAEVHRRHHEERTKLRL